MEWVFRGCFSGHRSGPVCLDWVSRLGAIEFFCWDGHKDRIEHALAQLYQPQSNSLGLIPGIKASFVRVKKKKKSHGKKKTWEELLFEWDCLITSPSTIPERGKMHIWELPDLAATRSYLVSAHNICHSITLTTSSYFQLHLHIDFFISIIPALATILLFWCLSTPFRSCEMSRNTSLNDTHNALFD